MSSFNVDLGGTYVAPLAVLLLVVAGVWLFVQRLLDALGLLTAIWHPALFFASLFAIMASASLLVLLARPSLLWQALGIPK